ncbi:MAG: LysM peptidoglycan-binding domain-containing protein [Peptococcaceae bacterium]|nr:LysM peptidoglycan-binding domain-containing protein [Peptococcaceae bacterium]
MIQVYRTAIRNYKVVVMFVSLIFLVFILTSFFCLSLGNTPHQIIKITGVTYERVTVQKGDTLWELAAKVNHDGDINAVVYKTMKYNNLQSSCIQPGQVIYLPVKS